MNFHITTSHADPYQVIHVAGEVDIATAPELQAALDKLAAEGETCLVIDLDEVTFLDSAGLRVLVAAHRSINDQRGQLRVVCQRGRIWDVFKLTNLDDVLSMHETLAAATAPDSPAGAVAQQ